MEARVLRSASELSPERWDGLVGGRSFYLSHRWTRYQESAPEATPHHVLIESSGRDAALLPGYLLPGADGASYDPVAVLGRRWAGPVLVLGSRRGHHNRLSRSPCATRATAGAAGTSPSSAASSATPQGPWSGCATRRRGRRA